jgi:hypothetical protein
MPQESNYKTFVDETTIPSANPRRSTENDSII